MFLPEYLTGDAATPPRQDELLPVVRFGGDGVPALASMPAEPWWVSRALTPLWPGTPLFGVDVFDMVWGGPLTEPDAQGPRELLDT